MKPRIWKSHGMWRCADNYARGVGYTPADAYLDWFVRLGLMR